jgi:hypothetical protein
MWRVGWTCVANAGIQGNYIDCLEYPEEEFNEVSCEQPCLRQSSGYECLARSIIN